MKNTKMLAAVLMAATLSLTVGCASSPKHEGTGQYVDEPSLKSMEINVETFKGRVQLSGFVSTQAAASTAVNVARGVPGVVSVKDDMRLK